MRPPLVTFAAWTLAASAWPLAAQTTKTFPTAPDDDAVVFAPFEVTLRQASGDQATDTPVGTRIKPTQEWFVTNTFSF